MPTRQGCQAVIGLFGVAMLFAVLSQAASGDPGIKTDRGVYPEGTPPALPAAGGVIIDPTFGTRILRVTDASDGANSSNAYSYWPTFNSNNTRFHINSGGAEKLYSFDPVTFQITGKSDLFAVAPPGGGSPNAEDSIWSTTDPNVIYAHTAAGLDLWAYNVSTQVYTLVHDFATDFPEGSGVGSVFQMSASTDGQRFAFTLKAPDPSYAVVGYAAWDRASGSFLINQSTTQLDEVQLDKTGRYLLVKTGISGEDAIEVRVADLSTGPFADLQDDFPDYSPGHSDCGRGTVAGADNWRNAVTFRNLATPHDNGVILSFGSDWSQGSHLSMLADNEDWALISTFSTGTRTDGVFHDEIFQVATDGSGDVRRLAHTYSVYHSYWDSPRADISLDGRFVAFTSNWGDSGRQDVFILDTLASVPEPATLTLLGTGALGVLGFIRRQRRR